MFPTRELQEFMRGWLAIPQGECKFPISIWLKKKKWICFYRLNISPESNYLSLLYLTTNCIQMRVSKLSSSHNGILAACYKELASYCLLHQAAAGVHPHHQQDTADPQLKTVRIIHPKKRTVRISHNRIFCRNLLWATGANRTMSKQWITG